jgi:Sec-independent protein translocase protein TatA
MTLFESAALGLVVAALVVKPSELPSLGRRAGRIAGRAVRRFQEMKRELGEYVEKNELRSVQEELEETMGQLNKIRQDVRSVSSVRGMMMDFAANRSVEMRGGGRDTENGVDEQGESTAPQGAERQSQTLPYAVLPVSARDVLRARETGQSPSTPSMAVGGSPPQSKEEPLTGSSLLRQTLEEERVAKAAEQFFVNK